MVDEDRNRDILRSGDKFSSNKNRILMRGLVLAVSVLVSVVLGVESVAMARYLTTAGIVLPASHGGAEDKHLSGAYFGSNR